MSIQRPNKPPASVLSRLGVLPIVLAMCAGCAKTDDPSLPLPVPALEPSRNALKVALDAWKSGRRIAGPPIGANPAVGVVDTLQAERPLRDYKILGAMGTLAEAQPFAVELHLDNPPEQVTTRYMVLGKDPLWVFRQEDYELIIHWEHKMSPVEQGESPDPPARDEP